MSIRITPISSIPDIAAIDATVGQGREDAFTAALAAGDKSLAIGLASNQPTPANTDTAAADDSTLEVAAEAENPDNVATEEPESDERFDVIAAPPAPLTSTLPFSPTLAAPSMPPYATPADASPMASSPGVSTPTLRLEDPRAKIDVSTDRPALPPASENHVVDVAEVDIAKYKFPEAEPIQRMAGAPLDTQIDHRPERPAEPTRSETAPLADISAEPVLASKPATQDTRFADAVPALSSLYEMLLSEKHASLPTQPKIPAPAMQIGGRSTAGTPMQSAEAGLNIDAAADLDPPVISIQIPSPGGSKPYELDAHEAGQQPLSLPPSANTAAPESVLVEPPPKITSIGRFAAQSYDDEPLPPQHQKGDTDTPARHVDPGTVRIASPELQPTPAAIQNSFARGIADQQILTSDKAAQIVQSDSAEGASILGYGQAEVPKIPKFVAGNIPLVTVSAKMPDSVSGDNSKIFAPIHAVDFVQHGRYSPIVTPTGNADQLSIASPAQQQVAEAIVRSGPASGETELVLTPEELGKVRFTITQNDSSITITITADRAETSLLLRRNADMLASELSQAGLAGASINFGESGRDRRGSSPPSITRGARDHDSPLAGPTPEMRVTQRQRGAGRLDLRL